jgi:hypothetical protein
MTGITLAVDWPADVEGVPPEAVGVPDEVLPQAATRRVAARVRRSGDRRMGLRVAAVPERRRQVE